MKLFSRHFSLVMVVAATYALSGCGQSPPAGTSTTQPTVASNSQAEAKGHDDHDHGHDHGHAKGEHKHDGWWCDEHGVPESECALCDPKVAAEFKKKGDWCKEHDRPDSQCFICHPEKLEEYAARYEAKFGKKPPKPELN